MCIYSNIPIAMLLVFLFVQQKNCLGLWLQHCLQLKKDYNHTVTKTTDVVALIKCGYWKTPKSFWIFLILVLFFLLKILSIQSIDFSTLYNTIPHEKLKIRLNTINFKNGR
jgi:hypothetical protein